MKIVDRKVAQASMDQNRLNIARDEATVLVVFDPMARLSLADLRAMADRAVPISGGRAPDPRFAPVLAIGEGYTKNLQPWTAALRTGEDVLVLRMRQVPEGNACPEVRKRAVAQSLAVLDVSTNRVFAPAPLQRAFETGEWASGATDEGATKGLYAGGFLLHSTFGEGRVLDIGVYKQRRVMVVEFEDRARVIDLEFGLLHVQPVAAP